MKQLPVPYLAALAHFTIEFTMSAMPILYPLLIVSLGLSYEQIGLVALMASIGGTITQPLFGFLSDRYDRRIFMVFSVTWIGVLIGSVGFVQSYWMLMVVVFLGALGSAAYHPSGAALAASGDPAHRGAAAGLFSASGGLGSSLSPLLIGLGLAYMGLRTSIILIPIAIVVTLLLLSQYRSYTQNTLDPSATAAKKDTKKVVGQSSLTLLILTIVITAARAWMHGGMINYLPEWLQSSGLSTEMAGSYLAILLAMISVGSFIGGPLSDRLGRIPVVIASFLFVGPTFWLFLHQSGITQMLIIGVVGFFLGISFPITIVMGQAAWPHGVGLASSLVMGLGWLPFGIGSWVIGRLADQTSLTSALGTLVFVPLVALVAAILAEVYSMRMKRNSVQNI
jgi:MFS transporter, FSR family, fosmidomycin resistance protein